MVSVEKHGNTGMFKITVAGESVYVTKAEAKKLLLALTAFKSAGEL